MDPGRAGHFLHVAARSNRAAPRVTARVVRPAASTRANMRDPVGSYGPCLSKEQRLAGQRPSDSVVKHRRGRSRALLCFEFTTGPCAPRVPRNFSTAAGLACPAARGAVHTPSRDEGKGRGGERPNAVSTFKVRRTVWKRSEKRSRRSSSREPRARDACNANHEDDRALARL